MRRSPPASWRQTASARVVGMPVRRHRHLRALAEGPATGADQALAPPPAGDDGRHEAGPDGFGVGAVQEARSPRTNARSESAQALTKTSAALPPAQHRRSVVLGIAVPRAIPSRTAGPRWRAGASVRRHAIADLTASSQFQRPQITHRYAPTTHRSGS